MVPIRLLCAEAGMAGAETRRKAERIILINFFIWRSMRLKGAGEPNAKLELAAATIEGIMPDWNAVVQPQRRGTDGQVKPQAQAVVVAEGTGAARVELPRSKERTGGDAARSGGFADGGEAFEAVRLCRDISDVEKRRKTQALNDGNAVFRRTQ